MRAPLCATLLLAQLIISVQTDLVVVPVAVTDAQGRPVSGLSQESFVLLDDGRPQTIVAFHRGDVPVTIGLVVDRSQSMRPKTSALLTVVSALLGESRPDDELFAVNFNDGVSYALPPGQAFTNDRTLLAAALTARRADGQTALYDGVAEGLQHLHAGHAGRRVLIVVSDGGDNASRHTYAQVLSLARQSDAVIYAIGLLKASTAEEEEDADVLQRLCHDTGGIAVFPRTPEETASMSARIARDLRAQYLLGFTPSAPSGGRAFRKIDVRVTSAGRGRLTVRTRSGYMPGGRAEAPTRRERP